MSSAQVAMEFQLRDYQVRPGELEQWLEEWQRQVRPLRIRLGFTIVGAWVVPEQNRFIWILGWTGPGSFQDADHTYYASPARKAIDPDPARHIIKAEHVALRSGGQ